MLFTRCPECETTFRVNDETLKKANGQVRCGRCASVFNAYAELHDPSAKNFEPELPKPRAPIDEQAAGPTTPATGPAAPPAATVPKGAAPQTAKPAPSQPDSTAASSGAASVADVATDAKVAAAHEEQQSALDADGAPSDEDLTATEIERVLTSNAGPPLPQSAYVWSSTATGGERRTASRWWSAAAALALLALAAQTIHYFRSDIASHPTFGPWISQAYDALGGEIAPHWDVRQYQIIDWIATAEPNSRGVGSLKITARIQNRGPLRQPYPAVQLRLKDRWEEKVGSRVFTPAEYLPRDTPRGRLMSPGETARAELEVVDPGPDAYGFELDVCIEVEASLVTCGSDEVFL
jgi:predicted Zn finger-like uncharacterized protein